MAKKQAERIDKYSWAVEGTRVLIKTYPLLQGEYGTITSRPSGDAAVVEFGVGQREYIPLRHLEQVDQVPIGTCKKMKLAELRAKPLGGDIQARSHVENDMADGAILADDAPTVDSQLAIVLPPVMNSSEASNCLSEIKGLFKSARTLLLEFKERRGWEALGYPHLTACLQDHFPESRTKLVRELFAAEIERDILQVPIGTCPASHFRPLSKVEPEHYKEVLDRATDLAKDKRLTAAHVTAAVAQVLPDAVTKNFQPQDLVKEPSSKHKQLLPGVERNPDVPPGELSPTPASVVNVLALQIGKPDVIITELSIGVLSRAEDFSADQSKAMIERLLPNLSGSDEELRAIIKAAGLMLNKQRHPEHFKGESA